MPSRNWTSPDCHYETRHIRQNAIRELCNPFLPLLPLSVSSFGLPPLLKQTERRGAETDRRLLLRRAPSEAGTPTASSPHPRRAPHHHIEHPPPPTASPPSAPTPPAPSASPPPSPTRAMEYSTATTPPRSAMENSRYSVPRSRRISNNELPLVHCEYCKCQFLKVLTAKMDKNYGRRFYICPTRTVRIVSCKFCVI